MVAVLLKEFRLTESMPPMSGVRFKTVTFVQIVYSIEVTSTQIVKFRGIVSPVGHVHNLTKGVAL
jgi:hypothetical protein